MNDNGGIDRNMSNDNFVEIQLKVIKQHVSRQGPNKCFNSAQLVCKTTQIVSEVKKGLRKESGGHVAGKARPDVDQSRDITKQQHG